MNSREKILSAVRKNKPTLSPLPEMELFEKKDINLVKIFRETLEKIGGQSLDIQENGGLQSSILGMYQDCQVICSLSKYVQGNLDIQTITDPHDLQFVDLAIVQGEFGVAENAAIWLPEANLIHRAVAFITQHLVIILDKKQLVWNMHEAYKRLEMKENGYGVFLAGPSKTADIEQSLVIGAHGARSLTVCLV
jgi:L-lactate dehydrogenase complex protein LldG